MRRLTRFVLASLPLAVGFSALATQAAAQDQQFATYITEQQWHAVNQLPGVDRQIVSRDIGDLNLSVGIIHRDATGGAASEGGGGAVDQEPECGVASADRVSGARGILHVHQTETYVVVSGGGTLVTGGEIMNGRDFGPESVVTTTLNGPSCSGMIVGDFVSRYVTEGDIVIIPEGTPHGWLNVPDHVDYLSVRPDPDRVLPEDYVNPALDNAVPEIKVTP